MLKNGWMRLWVVVTAFVLAAVAFASCFYVWGRDISYTFVGVAIRANASKQDRDLAEDIRSQATTKIFSGKFQYPPVMALEDLGRRGVVTQVSFEWLEPSGWSFKDHNSLDLLEGSRIKADL